MDSSDKFNETELPPKKNFYSEKNKEHISDKDYEHAQKVFKECCNNIGDYYDLYVQSDTLLLADVFEKFRNKFLEIYGLDPSYLYSAPGLAWKSTLKISKSKLELITNKDMLLMVEKGIRGGMCQASYKYATICY